MTRGFTLGMTTGRPPSQRLRDLTGLIQNGNLTPPQTDNHVSGEDDGAEEMSVVGGVMQEWKRMTIVMRWTQKELVDFRKFSSIH